MTSDDESVLQEPSEMEARSGAAFDRIVGNTVNSAITAWMATATGSPEAGALIGGTLGPLAEELSFAVRKIIDVRSNKANLMVRQAAAYADAEAIDLLDALVSDPLKMQLLVVALDAAGQATSEAKMDLIADLVATGALAADRAVVDEQLLALTAVKDLETPHFRLLLILDGPSPIWWDSDALRRIRRFAWTEHRLLEADPGLRNAMPALVARLISLGVAQALPISHPSEPPLWQLTSFGRICVESVKRRGGSLYSIQGGDS